MVESKGHLNPGDAGVTFDRSTLGLDRLVRHVWIVRWNLPAGRVLPQRVLTYPACNLVITPDEAMLYGPDASVSVRELAGRSWAVGVLLRPAAATVLSDTAAIDLVAASEPAVDAPTHAIRAAMAAGDPVDGILRDWLAPAAARVDEAGLLVNEACRLAEERTDIVRVTDLARRVGVTTRTLARIVKDRTGLTPKWLIECRRLQHAATTLYTRPETDLAVLAAELGYADQAHFTRRYHEVLNETPDQTRRAGRRRASR